MRSAKRVAMGRPRRAGNPAKSAHDALHDATVAAKAARLHYADIGAAGLSRRRMGRGFAYFSASGTRIDDPAKVARIRALAIPPAWSQVVISPSARAHLQAYGFDAKGRKQYKYHPEFRAVRDAAKYEHLARFAAKLPQLRRIVTRDLKRPGLERAKVLALVVQLMQRTCIRVGNECYAAKNGCYGLTTLRDRHVRRHGADVEFRFKGKSGKGTRDHGARSAVGDPSPALPRCTGCAAVSVPRRRWQLSLHTRRRRQSVPAPGYQGRLQREGLSNLGRHAALHALTHAPSVTSAAAAKRQIRSVLEGVAQHLGNTVAVCRKSYVHPMVLEQFGAGQLPGAVQRATARARKRPVRGLSRAETTTLHWLLALGSRNR
jgi:DNA topoisomerase I